MSECGDAEIPARGAPRAGGERLGRRKAPKTPPSCRQAAQPNRPHPAAAAAAKQWGAEPWARGGGAARRRGVRGWRGGAGPAGGGTGRSARRLRERGAARGVRSRLSGALAVAAGGARPGLPGARRARRPPEGPLISPARVRSPCAWCGSAGPRAGGAAASAGH